MSKSIFTFVIAVLLSSMAFPANASANKITEFYSLTATSERLAAGIDRKKKRKLKKKVRQAGEVYKLVKPDKQNKKKVRKAQRKVRRLINSL